MAFTTSFITCECGHSEWVHYKGKCQLCDCKKLKEAKKDVQERLNH